ncbi:glutathione s transferase [Stylonychia lemnae]|uniref:Glutathione s transferase n=1 Tax=Stylonychia lemnae TaxID=5949 RepID=A0A077ZTI2_STYLE|nr:glutathione s transferase [Stylonychia lemnae]|eukprot:CDW73228.1 glutathione s transferase [Stylonychia lemnae]
MKIHYFPLSGPSHIVLNVADQLGVEYEKVLVNITGGDQHKDEFVKKNGNKKVPVLEDDDGTTLSEAMSIIKYLSDKHSSDLYPKDLKERALVDMHLAALNDARSAGLGLVYFEVIFPRQDPPIIINPMIIGLLRQNVEKILGDYNTQVEGKDYAVLDRLTLVDFVLSGIFIWLAFIQYDPSEKFPHLCTYFKNLSEKLPRLLDCQRNFHENLKALSE